MKLKELEPSTPVEHKIVLLLGMRGIKKNRLNFKGMHNDRFFSFGHWSPIKAEDIAYVQEHTGLLIDEISWHDSDCGWQCYYQFAS
jgi:hypothetical protein|tara:strand:- start:195 stop:452 length:258 start_codon:yes stop_codon:yes gene_type:complete